MSNNNTVTVTNKVKELLATARTFNVSHWTFTVINAWQGDKCPECGLPVEPGTQAYRVHDIKSSDDIVTIHPNCLGLFFKNRRV